METDSRTKKLVEIFQSEKVLNLGTMQEILNTKSRMTIFRRLKALGYYSSYSHCGKYYTLRSIPEFDENGLWDFGGVHFSEHGSLMETIVILVKRSEAGYFAIELEELLSIAVHNSLRKICSSGQLPREQIGSFYLYLSPILAADQLGKRKKIITEDAARCSAKYEVNGDKMTEHLKTLLSVFDEKQRRLFLGFESLKIGHGGDVQIASAAEVNVKTVSRGRKELVSKEIDFDRVRSKGAGRPPLKKKKSYKSWKSLWKTTSPDAQ